MRDQEIQQRVLSRNTSGDLTTLAKLVDYIAAEEARALKSSDHDATRTEQQQQIWDMQSTMQPSTMEDLIPLMAALR